jgi:hypothetical protein
VSRDEIAGARETARVKAGGGIERLETDASSIVEAHRALGAAIARPARVAIEKRIASRSAAALSRELDAARASLRFLEVRVARPTRAVPDVVRRGVDEHLASLAAWAEAAGLGALAKRHGARAIELAAWAQDDSGGCQTGALRLASGDVLAWHTEEDTIGLFDKPRVLTMRVDGVARSAFLYPYLLPGPAFGFRRDRFHAVDTLHVDRRRGGAGSLTSVASWLVWRLDDDIPPREVLRALAPFSDACAIVVVDANPGGVAAHVHEVGARFVETRALGRRPGDRLFQANAVSDSTSPLGRVEALGARRRRPYEARARRDAVGIERLGVSADLDGVRDVLASRAGRGYAYANADVVAHAITLVSRSGLEVHVGAGAATRGSALQLERAT